jgi:hypothetical protein
VRVVAKNKYADIKTDGVFRIFTKTNAMKRVVVVRIELPNNEIHKLNYGNVPDFETVVPYIGQVVELHLDDELLGLRIVKEADKEHIVFADYEEDEV